MEEESDNLSLSKQIKSTIILSQVIEKQPVIPFFIYLHHCSFGLIMNYYIGQTKQIPEIRFANYKKHNEELHKVKYSTFNCGIVPNADQKYFTCISSLKNKLRREEVTIDFRHFWLGRFIGNNKKMRCQGD